MRLPNIIYKTLRRGKIKPTKYPTRIDVGLTNLCNLNCSMCPNDKITRPRGYMDKEMFYSIIDCIGDKMESKPVLGLGLFGESTLHPHFIDFLKYADSRKVKTVIASNFTLITDKVIKAMVESKMELVEISFYTLNRDGYNELVGQNSYDKAMANIHAFLKLATNANFSGAVRLRPFKSEELNDYKKEFYDQYPKINFQRQEPKELVDWLGVFGKTSVNGIYTNKTCPSIFSRFVVDFDGEVRLCCQAMLADDLAIGYISDVYDVYDVWNSHELDIARKSFNDLDYSKYPSCLKCSATRRPIANSVIKKVIKK